MPSRDHFRAAARDPLAPAFARLDAFLDEVAEVNAPVYSSRLNVAGYATGEALLAAPEAERAETAAAALIRYTQQRRGYTGGVFSAGDYSPEDFQNCIERVAQALLRKRLPFADATLLRLVTDVGDYAARNARSFPIKGLLLQLEHHAKPRGLSTGYRAPLAAMLDVLAAEREPPQICREVAQRLRALLGTKRR